MSVVGSIPAAVCCTWLSEKQSYVYVYVYDCFPENHVQRTAAGFEPTTQKKPEK
jgi:hypothetical protein